MGVLVLLELLRRVWGDPRDRGKEQQRTGTGLCPAQAPLSSAG